MLYKVGVKKWTDIEYYGENHMVSSDYWTTVEARDEREAKLLAKQNLLPRIAKNELFTLFDVRQWKRLYLDLSDMVIGE